MAFDFPAAPAVNDEYTSGGVAYIWNGTAWDFKGSGDLSDYVLKAGDVMAGPLGFGLDTFNIVGNTMLNYSVPATAKHYFYVDGVEKARIEGGGNSIIGNGHIRAQGGGAFAHDRTADNQPGIYFYAAQIRSKGGSNEGKFEIWTDNGGWSSAACSHTTVASGVAGIYVYNDCSAVSFTDRGSAATKSDIRDCNDAEIRDAFAALRPKRFRKNIPAPAPTKEKPWPIPPNKLRWGFVVDDIYANPATKDIATLAYVPETEGKQFEPEGTDIMQVLALTVAKLKLVEAELELLKKKVR